ncbi:type II toxin-antitoxin system RelB/DinJ family antitoxin [Adlercreutzia sp. ZJ242]|uniref:type II toxin-antitoxin system RelB/DinJ family antitoxin n=1 Tax=Adlercreutzia sp. ZJ242 TaxID=2709409 RepID=UPI001F150ECC|nr:type II toxin-antitoxin system RelB/DinJ family antitoxin [Adlercreutzia sp. ZJ242]
MATSTINIRLDSDLKRKMEEVSSDIGLTPTAAFNVFARQFVAHRGFPFAVVAPVPTEREFADKMDSIYLSMRDGNVVEHELAEL